MSGARLQSFVASALAPLAAMIVVFGVMPSILTGSFAESVEMFLMSAISVVGQ